MKFSKLLGKIKEVFGTQEKFAKAMKMSRSALCNRLNGTVDWKVEEVILACELLGIPFTEAFLYFFIKMS